MKFSARRYKRFEKNILTDLEAQQVYLPLKRFGRNRFKAQNFMQSVGFALEGLAYSFRTQRNFRIDCLAALGVTGLGLLLGISLTEWAVLVVVMGVVFITEAMNTAIEYTVDMFTQGEFDMRAKVIKDISAGACLMAASISVLVGGCVFWPHLVRLVQGSP